VPRHRVGRFVEPGGTLFLGGAEHPRTADTREEVLAFGELALFSDSSMKRRKPGGRSPITRVAGNTSPDQQHDPRHTMGSR
jgi:hypothetical protein